MKNNEMKNSEVVQRLGSLIYHLGQSKGALRSPNIEYEGGEYPEIIKSARKTMNRLIADASKELARRATKED